MFGLFEEVLSILRDLSVFMTTSSTYCYIANLNLDVRIWNLEFIIGILNLGTPTSDVDFM